MALILNIESATNVCSVAVALNGEVLSLRENNEGQSHARVLTSLISESLREAGKNMSDLSAISVSKGPGSFTGLRIGVATAKGLCYALNIPLISVNTLLSMAFQFKTTHPTYDEMLFCPMLDARRMEVYSAVLNPDLTFRKETSAVIIEEGSFTEILSEHEVVFFGDGMSKTTGLIGSHKNARFIHDFEPSAAGMIQFSENSYNLQIFESVAYFEPFYLKDFYSPRQRH